MGTDEKYITFKNIFLHYFNLNLRYVNKIIEPENNKEWITKSIKTSALKLKQLYIMMSSKIIDRSYYNA